MRAAIGSIGPVSKKEKQKKSARGAVGPHKPSTGARVIRDSSDYLESGSGTKAQPVCLHNSLKTCLRLRCQVMQLLLCAGDRVSP